MVLEQAYAPCYPFEKPSKNTHILLQNINLFKKKNADLHDLISILDIKTDTLRMFRKDSLQTLNKDGPR